MDGFFGASGLWHIAFLVCVSYQVWPVGAAGGPFWHTGKDACVCLCGLLEQLASLFGTEAKESMCALLAC